jgi:hypothetical protein
MQMGLQTVIEEIFTYNNKQRMKFVHNENDNIIVILLINGKAHWFIFSLTKRHIGSMSYTFLKSI